MEAKGRGLFRHLRFALLGGAALLVGCPSSEPGPGTAAAGSIGLDAPSYTVSEGGGVLHVGVTRTGGTAGAAIFQLTTADGTATAGTDYTVTSATVTFADGEVGPKTVDVPILQDATTEGNESFQIRLARVSGEASLGSPSQATATILDDDVVAGQGFALDDTGVTTCSTPSQHGLPCASAGAGTDAFPRQDAENGRDTTVPADADGHAGFSFRKLDAAGVPLADQSGPFATNPWPCVADVVTGLTWEVRTNDGGLRDGRWRYTWFASTGLRGAAGNGRPNGGTCADTSSCDTEKYVAAVNASGLCGKSDWRLPSRAELLSLVDYGAAAAPLLDAAFLPDGTAASWWSATADWFGNAWAVDFGTGGVVGNRPAATLSVRLVRGGF